MRALQLHRSLALGLARVVGLDLALALALAVVVSGCGSTGIDTVCVPACAPGYHCSGGTCVATGGDMAMPPPSMSCAVACAVPKPYCNPAGQCVGCLLDTQCAAGRRCKDGQCVTGCTDDSGCGGPMSSQRCCSQLCVDVSSSTGNCGACGSLCAPAHAAALCTAGKCSLGACEADWKDCNADPKDGCEANTAVDANNCGACGMKCAFAHGVAACARGCYITACDFGWDDCDMDPTNGCETAVSSDAKNCGGCGMGCAGVPNAQVVCANASCAVQSCNAGFLDCDHNGNNGCEVDARADASNCGQCGNTCRQGLVCRASLCTCPQCMIPNASSRCDPNNNCVLDQCNPGYADCDNNPKNGCEVNIAYDAANCGSCGTACAVNLVCNNGKCAKSGGAVYMTSSNGTAGFYKYDIVKNSWTTPMAPPVVTYSQLTTDGTNVYQLGSDNRIYQYSPGNNSWTMTQAGPGPQASTPIGLFKWTPLGFYHCKDSQLVMSFSAAGGNWTPIMLAVPCSSAGTYDAGSANIYIRINGQLGVIIFNTANNTVTQSWPLPNKSCGENSRTGSFYAGKFYDRNWADPLQVVDVATGVSSALNITPTESHTSSDVNPATGDIYFGPYTPTGTAFQVYNVPNNTLRTLTAAPVSVSNHSTIVYVPN